MQVYIYLEKREQSNLLACLDVEGLPATMSATYEIDGVVYRTLGLPRFIIETTRSGHRLKRADLLVEKYEGHF